MLSLWPTQISVPVPAAAQARPAACSFATRVWILASFSFTSCSSLRTLVSKICRLSGSSADGKAAAALQDQTSMLVLCCDHASTGYGSLYKPSPEMMSGTRAGYCAARGILASPALKAQCTRSTCTLIS